MPNDPETHVSICMAFRLFGLARALDRKRVHQIVKFTTGHFPHFYRGIGETGYGKLVFQNDVFKLKDFMGLNDIRPVFPYVAEPFHADVDRFNKAKSIVTSQE